MKSKSDYPLACEQLYCEFAPSSTTASNQAGFAGLNAYNALRCSSESVSTIKLKLPKTASPQGQASPKRGGLAHGDFIGALATEIGMSKPTPFQNLQNEPYYFTSPPKHHNQS
jgi:hypothetical protein